MDPHDPKDFKRLVKAVEMADKALEHPRQECATGIQNMVGHNFFTDGSDDKRPINMTAVGTCIYAQKLVGSAPQVLISTEHQSLKAECKDFECVTNHEIKRLDVEGTLREATICAIFGLGIVKVGIADDGIQTEENFSFEKTRPYADVVLFEDFVFDVSAKRERNCRFMGHRYTIPLAEAKKNEKFDKDARKKLIASSKSEASADEKSNMSEENYDPDEFEEMVELWEIWLAFEDLIVTFACDGDSREPLRVEKWKPPSKECLTGPYHILGLDDVPGNVLYLPPESLWRDLDEITNRMYNKITRQAEAAKTVFTYRDEGDAENIRTAGDLEFIRSSDPTNVNPISVGAVDNNLLAFQMNAKDSLDWQGNFSIAGGLGAQTGTVGQEKMLTETSSDRMNKYQRRVMQWSGRILRDLAFYIWENPVPYPRMSRELPGTNLPPVPVRFGHEPRQGDFLDYNVEIVQFSMQQKSPAERYQTLMQTFMQVILPLQPQLEAQGVSVNFQKLLETVACYTNTPEINDILVYSGPPQPGGTYSQGPKQPPPSPGRSSPAPNGGGRSVSGQSKIMQQALVGGKPQGSEMGRQISVGRSA